MIEMNRKYEFVEGDTITLAGRTLHRIRALEDFIGVKRGDLGGYIETSNNLKGEAWVFENAHVYGNARVTGNALVYGSARVGGYAWVSGNAQISGNALVYGNAKVGGNARISGNSNVCGNADVCGDAYVYGNARVTGNSFVYGNVRVYGDAFVGGHACVCGNAQVSGSAKVYGNADVCGDASVDKNNVFVASNVGSARGNLTVFTGASGNLLVTRGCFYGTDEEFLEKVRRRHAGTRYQTEYELLIQVARSRILGE